MYTNTKIRDRGRGIKDEKTTDLDADKEEWIRAERSGINKTKNEGQERQERKENQEII